MAITSMAEMAKSPDPGALDFMIDHIFLPPRLPQEDDENSSHTNATIRVLRDSVGSFLSAEPGSAPSVRPAFDMLDRFVKMDTGKMDTGKMDTGKMDTGKMDTGKMDTGRGVDEDREVRSVRDIISDLKNGGMYSPSLP